MKLLPITITGKTLSTTASPAVKGDKDIDALSIAVPISYEGTNLAQDAWHIRFKLPGGTVHIDPLTDGVPNDAEVPATLTFTYPMQGLIVSQSGNVALQIVNVPANGSSIFQTLPGPSITVSSTLEGPPSADYNAAPWGTYLAQYIAIRDETKQYRDQAQQIASDIHDEYVFLDEKKVDKIPGKGLSTEDYTTEEKSKLAGVESGAQVNAVTSVAGKAGAVTLVKGDVGLGNVDNTPDAQKPVSTAQQAALDLKIPLSQKGSASGVATLDEAGKVPSTQLPSYVDDVLEFGSFSLLPASGESGKIYVTLDTNLQYRWGGSAYTEVSKSLALGETPESAHRGDHGKVAYEHVAKTDNPHSVTKAQVGLGSVDNTPDSAKPVSTLQQQAFDLKLDKSDVVDNLTTDDASKALSAKQGKTLSEQLSILDERVMFIEHRSKLTTWAEVQDAAKNGLASRYLKVGDLVETSYGGSPAVVELFGINHPFDIPPVGVEYGDVLSWGFKDCLQNAQYSAPQALFNAVEGLSAGTYTFVNSNDSLPYTFTLTQAVPVGGVIVITSWGASTYEPTVLKTMQADRLTDIETGVAVTQASGGTALAPVNLTPRCRYGANLYIESGIRHFLNDNSDSYLWVAQGLYDMPSTYGAGGGFLKRLDADFASVIGPVIKKVARATADGGGQDTFEDKVWLLSRVEMGYGTEGVTTGEQVYERWNGATNAERIKLLSGSPRHWWLRPPYVSYQSIARIVYTDGTLNSNYSYYSYGLAPGLAVY